MQFKRQRIKTGPNSWINITQRQNGTTFRSVSNKANNVTTNISSRGVRKTQNNNGWIKRDFWAAYPKNKSTNKKSPIKSLFFKSSRKKKKIIHKKQQHYEKVSWSETKADLQEAWKDIRHFGEPVQKEQFYAILFFSVIGVVIWISIFGY